MAVGMPGTGLGGVFYFLMAAAMPFVELCRRATGRKDEGSWRVVGIHVALLSGLLLVMWLEAVAIKYVLLAVRSVLSSEAMVAQAIDGAANQMAPALALLPFIILGAILGGLELLRMEVQWWERCRAARQSQISVTPLAG